MQFLAAGPRRWRFPLLLMTLLTMLAGPGCSPESQLSSDDDRDYQRARDAARLGEYDTAAEYYERALERNPRAAAVHLSYASLCEAHLNRFAYAVYHYQRYLQLRPNDQRAEDIRQRVTNCTERLATSVPLVIRSESIARDLEAVRKENQTLRKQQSELLLTVQQWSNEVQRLTMLRRDGTSAEPAPRTNGSTQRQAPPGDSRYRTPLRNPTTGTTNRASATANAASRTHRVKSGETMIKIARHYGIPLDSLLRANPQINERRLLPGTVLRIPAARSSESR